MDDNKASVYKCEVCGQPINLRHNNYRVVAISLDPAWFAGQRGAPPQNVMKHRHCMDPDEWTCAASPDATPLA